MPLNTFLQRRVVGRPALVVVLWYRYLSNDALASSWRGTPAPRSTSSSSSCSRTTGQCRRRSLTLKFSNTRRARAERSAQDLHDSVVDGVVEELYGAAGRMRRRSPAPCTSSTTASRATSSHSGSPRTLRRSSGSSVDTGLRARRSGGARSMSTAPSSTAAPRPCRRPTGAAIRQPWPQ